MLAEKTLIKDIIDEESRDTLDSKVSLEKLTLFELHKIIFDFSKDFNTRLNAFELYYKLNPEDISEILNKFSSTYTFTGSELIKKFLRYICIHCDVPFELKIECVKNLCDYQSINLKENNNFDILNTLCNNEIFFSLNILCQINTVIFLMKSKDYKENALNFFKKIITNKDINCDYRYKAILSLENHIQNNVENKNYFIKESLLTFLFDKFVFSRNKILAAQYLLQKYYTEMNVEKIEKIENVVVNIATDEDLDINIRADAADSLLKLGNDKNKNLAKEIILTLGSLNGPVRSIFDYGQNVHMDSITDSVMDILENLNSSLKTSDISFKNICNEIKKYQYSTLKDPKDKSENNFKEKRKLVKISLNRIYSDRALYGKQNQSLISILYKVWNYMLKNEHKEEIMKRLVEELIDMSGTCSSGYVSRLINTISSFGNFSIKISWEEQIAGNLSGRLNAKIREIKDEDLKGNILVELYSGNIGEKPNLYVFLVQNLSKIREEMFNEFKDHMEDTDFDLFFKKAMISYEK